MLSFDNLGSPVTNHMKRKRSPELPLSYMASKRRSVDALDIFGVNMSDPAFAIPDSLAYQEVDTKWLVDSRFSNVDRDLSQPPLNMARSHA